MIYTNYSILGIILYNFRTYFAFQFLKVAIEKFINLIPTHIRVERKQNVSLNDCFDEYTKKEILDEDNQYTNDEGHKVVAKQIEFWKFPTVLVVTLKRFTNSMRKNIKFFLTKNIR